jgi:PAS domain S-box-containing protein
LDEGAALRSILEGTAKETGERFFQALVENLAKVLGTPFAWVTEYLEEKRRLKALAFWMEGKWVPDYETHIEGTPCETVVKSRNMVLYPERVVDLFPDEQPRQLGVVSYMGAPLLDLDGKVLGHLAVMDRKPMPKEPRMEALFQIFAGRAAAELRRLRAERQVIEREKRLSGLVDSAMDAIIGLDRELHITRINPAAEKVCGCPAAKVIGKDFGRFLADESRQKLATLLEQLDSRPADQRHLWIPGGLEARRYDGGPFPAEATLSGYEVSGRVNYTLILRNVNERLKAEQQIERLSHEAEYLRAELDSVRGFDQIIGNSPSLLRALSEVTQVAETDATVLILGETGTGKELFAHAIHTGSRRADQPLIKVNCAAIPTALMESEFFGHEKGAFTGATGRREGRFALADGGTLFLDEVGELPLDLQAKLLRVLQEGEFEPVGSSRTRKVDVRLIAATNRDLKALAAEGKFREDLYYRLNVFPIRIPPLRERKEDIPVLATAFAERYASRMGRTVAALTAACIARLQSYNWPGNVRELQNVIERAVITARDGRMNLAQALPDVPEVANLPEAPEEAPRIRTLRELEEIERANLVRALEATGWKVAGGNGAAALLGMNPSTLSSRMKALGIRRPAKP